MALNVCTAVIGSGCNTATATPSLAQWDVGQVLKIEGVDLPAAYQVEFSTEYTRNAIQKIGNAGGVAVPNELLQRSAPITAYIVLHEGENDRETEYWITIHITPRTPPETITPDPEEQSVIDETIAALQDGVAAAEAAQAAAEDAAESIEDSAAQIAQNTQDIADLEDEKQDKPATAGTAGQVLGLDSNLDPAWVDQTGGVTSVNGKTGAVTLDASDVGAGTYSKPSGGIPASDLASAVQTSLGKADSAYQKPVGGIPATDLASAVQTSLGKADTALQSAPVSSVAGKTGAVTLDAGDIEFDDSETYPAGSLGAEVSDQKNAINQKADKTVATTTADGLMSASDKTKLDDVYADYSSALVALGVI